MAHGLGAGARLRAGFMRKSAQRRSVDQSAMRVSTVLLRVRGYLHPELRALLPNAIEPHLSLHQLGKPLGDGEPQTGTFDRPTLLSSALTLSSKIASA